MLRDDDVIYFQRDDDDDLILDTNTNPYDIKAIAVGRSGCACGVQKVIVCWGGVGRRGCRVALVCVLSLKPFGLSGVISFLCVVLPRSRDRSFLKMRNFLDALCKSEKQQLGRRLYRHHH